MIQSEASGPTVLPPYTATFEIDPFLLPAQRRARKETEKVCGGRFPSAVVRQTRV